MAFDFDEADPTDDDSTVRTLAPLAIVPGDPTIGVLGTLNEQWMVAFDKAGKPVALNTK